MVIAPSIRPSIVNLCITTALFCGKSKAKADLFQSRVEDMGGHAIEHGQTEFGKNPERLSAVGVALGTPTGKFGFSVAGLKMPGIASIDQSAVPPRQQSLGLTLWHHHVASDEPLPRSFCANRRRSRCSPLVVLEDAKDHSLETPLVALTFGPARAKAAVIVIDFDRGLAKVL